MGRWTKKQIAYFKFWKAKLTLTQCLNFDDDPSKVVKLGKGKKKKWYTMKLGNTEKGKKTILISEEKLPKKYKKALERLNNEE